MTTESPQWTWRPASRPTPSPATPSWSPKCEGLKSACPHLGGSPGLERRAIRRRSVFEQSLPGVRLLLKSPSTKCLEDMFSADVISASPATPDALTACPVRSSVSLHWLAAESKGLSDEHTTRTRSRDNTLSSSLQYVSNLRFTQTSVLSASLVRTSSSTIPSNLSWHETPVCPVAQVRAQH